MKTRNSFVSNSSSTSFLLYSEEDREFFRKRGIEIHSVREITEKINKIVALLEEAKKIQETLPYFMTNYYKSSQQIVDDYQNQLTEIDQSASISDPVDRDNWYEDILEHSWTSFEEDL